MSEIEYREFVGTISTEYDPIVRLEKVKRLLLDGADPNIRGNNRETPIFMAARIGDYNIVKLLIESGARVDVRAKLGTPLSAAVEGRNFNIIKLILDTGAPMPSSLEYYPTEVKIFLMKYRPSLSTLARRSILRYRIDISKLPPALLIL